MRPWSRRLENRSALSFDLYDARQSLIQANGSELASPDAACIEADEIRKHNTQKIAMDESRKQRRFSVPRVLFIFVVSSALRECGETFNDSMDQSWTSQAKNTGNRESTSATRGVGRLFGAHLDDCE